MLEAEDARKAIGQAQLVCHAKGWIRVPSVACARIRHNARAYIISSNTSCLFLFGAYTGLDAARFAAFCLARAAIWLSVGAGLGPLPVVSAAIAAVFVITETYLFLWITFVVNVGIRMLWMVDLIR